MPSVITSTLGFASARKPQDVAALRGHGLEALELDLESSASVQTAAQTVLERTGGKLYGLINNGATADGTGPHPFQSNPVGQTGWSAALIAAQAYSGQFAVSVYAICVNQS